MLQFAPSTWLLLAPDSAALARRYHWRGHKVVLLEAGKAGRHKVCGEFVSPKSRATLARLGVTGALVNAGAVAIERAHSHFQSSRRRHAIERAGFRVIAPEI